MGPETLHASPATQSVEEKTFETQFDNTQDLKPFAMASLALEQLELVNNSMRETLLAAQRLLRRQEVDSMRQTTIEAHFVLQ